MNKTRIHDNTLLPLVFDPTLNKVGCVLLQAALGGTRGLCYLFDTEDWFLAPTENMKMYQGTREEWEQVALKIKKEREENEIRS